MDKRSALKLAPGDWIIYGDAGRGQHVSRYLRGEVAYVTPRGGIKLTTGGWVPYHHVLSKDHPTEQDEIDGRVIVDWHDVRTQPWRRRG